MRRTMTAAAIFLLAAAALAPGWAAELQGNTWARIDEGRTGQRQGAVLLRVGARMLLFGGGVKGAPYVQAFDPATRTWTEFSKAGPKVGRGGMHPYYQTAYDPKTKTVYCLSAGPVFSFNVEKKAWKSLGHPAELHGLSWHAAAIDPAGRKLVVVGSDKHVGNLGWTRTAIMSLDSAEWSTLPLPHSNLVKQHRDLVAAQEALIDFVGRIRLAWYRDPVGAGTEDELKALGRRCEALAKMPGMAVHANGILQAGSLLAKRKTLDALKSARHLQRSLDEYTDRQYPVPPSRRNSPLVFDPKNKVFVMFGGDHEDYLTNDTWILDLRKGWRRAEVERAPSPRAGHQLVYLPRSGKVALYEGYVQSSNSDYRSGPSYHVGPRQIWVYDVEAGRWDLLKAWDVRRGDKSLPRGGGFFHGYSAQFFSPPALAADGGDRLVLALAGGGRSASETWMIKLDLARLDAAGRGKLGKAPNQRLYRVRRFLASYCEVPATLKPTNLDNLPTNKWVKMPQPPRDVTRGCRQRDWGTAVWDSENDQVVRWGGGHCIRSASTPVHYSFASGRMVEGYDADEPYGYNGGGGFGSSVMGRPWVPTHGYNLYAYDPPSGLVITATGFLYDPARMDWLRMPPMKQPFRFSWSSTVVETSPHGVVAWADSLKGGVGLWLYDREKGWHDLKPQGKLFRPYCDSDGMCYDSKRDRMLLGWGGGYGKKGDGRIFSFNFKTRAVEKLMPANIDLGKMHNTREMVYVEHADLVLFGSAPRTQGKKAYTVAYDCAANKYLLLDAGGVVYGHGAAWMYDAKRKLVLATAHRHGDAYALRLDSKTATLVEAP